MIGDIIGRRYAEAIYALAAEKGNPIELYENLEFFLSSYDGNKDFRDFINHPSLSIEEKKSVLEKTFKNALDELAFTVLNYIIEKRRLGDINSIVNEYKNIYNEKNSIIEIEAIFAVEISEEQKTKLIKKLEKVTSKTVKLEVSKDSSIIAGGILKIGDKIIDGSLKRQFEMLRSSL